MRVLILIVAAATLIATTNAEAAIRWHEDFGRAQKIATQTGRPMLLHFWKSGCPGCVRMEQTVFPRTDVERAIQTGYIPVKINANRSPSLAQRFGIRHQVINTYEMEREGYVANSSQRCYFCKTELYDRHRIGRQGQGNPKGYGA